MKKPCLPHGHSFTDCNERFVREQMHPLDTAFDPCDDCKFGDHEDAERCDDCVANATQDDPTPSKEPAK